VLAPPPITSRRPTRSREPALSVIDDSRSSLPGTGVVNVRPPGTAPVSDWSVAGVVSTAGCGETRSRAALPSLRLRKVGCVLVNCWGRSSVRSLAELIAEAFLIHQSRRGMSLKRILGAFAHLRPQVSVDPQTGEPSFSVDLARTPELPPRSLERVLDPIREEGRRRPLAVVFDEFQALMQLDEWEELMFTRPGASPMRASSTC